MRLNFRGTESVFRSALKQSHYCSRSDASKRTRRATTNSESAFLHRHDVRRRVPFVTHRRSRAASPINVFTTFRRRARTRRVQHAYDANAPEPMRAQCHDDLRDDAFTFLKLLARRVRMMTNVLSTTRTDIRHQRTYGHGALRHSCATNGVCRRRVTRHRPPRHHGRRNALLVLDPLLCEYHTTSRDSPYQQLTLGAIGTTLAEQTAWSALSR